ncbi:helix-turn-helix domain-containing protein [Pseudomonas sp. NPDC089752]|uniref:AraC family transcriptional regulator n=1 Tax=Pseudomonas sp. NPDC089752 TaxID=3364472 RepID=UPI00380EFED2
MNSSTPFHAPVMSALQAQLGAGPQWSFGADTQRMALAQWDTEDVQFTHPESSACTLIFHLSGSTRVSGFKAGRCVGQGARHASITLLGNESTRWELGGQLSFVHLYLSQGALDDYVQRTQGIARAPWLKPCFAKDDPWLSALFMMIVQDHMLNRTANESRLLSHMGDLILEHLLQFYSHRVLPSEPARTSTRLTARVLSRVDEFLQANLTQNVVLADLAAIACLSEGHFIRAFKRSTGMTPHQMLIARRVEKASQLLTDRSLTLAQVAHSTGFASGSHLGVAFRRRHGVTPGQYRALKGNR